MNIILINGPPGVGKDTLGAMLENKIHSSKTVKFAGRLDAIASIVLPFEVTNNYPLWREEKKDEPLPGTTTSMRQLLIAISEDLIKPIFGRDYFGARAAEMIEYLYETGACYTFIFTDSGFQCEYERLVKDLTETYDDVGFVLVNLHRKGHTFEGDSREWVKPLENTFNTTIFNDGSLADLEDTSDFIVQCIQNGDHRIEK